MHNKSFFRLLKGLGLMALVFPLYPVLALLSGLVSVMLGSPRQELPTAPLLAELLVCVCSGFWSVGMAYLVNRLRGWGKGPFRWETLCWLLQWMLAVLPVVLSGFFGNITQPDFWILRAGMLAAAIAAGVRCRMRYGEVLPQKLWVACLIVSAAAVFVFWLMKASYDPMPMAWLFFGYLAVYYLIANQANLDYLMERRKHKLEHLPKKIRRNNTTMVLAIFGLIWLAFLLKDFWAWLFRRLLWVCRQLLYWLLRGIFWLFSLFPQSGEPVEEEAAGSPGGMEGLPPGEEASPWADLIFFVLITFLALFLLFYYRESIFRLLRKAWQKLGRFFARLMAQARRQSKASDSSAEAGDYYTDDVERLNLEEIRAQRQREQYRLRDWKRQYRVFAGMPEDAGKLRYGYRLALEWVLLRGGKIADSDTPQDILQRVGHYLPPEAWAEVTDSYQKIRYGELTEQISGMGTLCGVLSGLMKS